MAQKVVVESNLQAIRQANRLDVIFNALGDEALRLGI